MSFINPSQLCKNQIEFENKLTQIQNLLKEGKWLNNKFISVEKDCHIVRILKSIASYGSYIDFYHHIRINNLAQSIFNFYNINSKFQSKESYDKVNSIINLLLNKTQNFNHKSALYKTLDKVYSLHKDQIKAEELKKYISQNDLDIIEKYFVFPNDALLKNFMGNNALLTAVENKNYSIAKFLIEKGADIEKPGKNGLTPLMLACEVGYLPLVRLLIKKGANLNVQNDEKKTPLSLACLSKNQEIVQLLLDKGAHVNPFDNTQEVFINDINRMKQIKELIVKDNFETLKKVFNPEKDFNLRDFDCNTPLIIAIKNGKKHIVDYFLEKGANVDETGSNESTPLMYACEKDDFSLAQCLINKGANVNATNKYGMAPLTYACIHKHSKAIELLVENGANIKARDKYFITALNRAYSPDLSTSNSDFLQVIKKLEGFEISSFFPKFFYTEKMFCHRFGINHQIQNKLGNFKLDGFFNEYSFPEVLASLKKFILNNPSIKNSNCIDWNQVLQIASKMLDNLINLKNVLSKNNSESIIPILTEIEDHSTGLLVSKSDNILMICDRSIVNGKKPGLRIYQIGKPENLPDVLPKILQDEWIEGEEYRDKICSELELIEIGYLKHKNQSIGNCTWASPKAIIRGIIYFLLRSSLGHEKADELSYRYYKEWTKFDRYEALKDFIEGYQKVKEIQNQKNLTDEDLREEGIIPFEILEKAIYKCSRDELMNCLELLKEKIPSLFDKIKESLLFDVYCKSQKAVDFLKKNARELIKDYAL